MSPKALSGVLTALVAAFAGIPAYAQGFDMQETQYAQPQLPNIGRPYSIRVTTGAHTTAGWEKGLTDGDPNLKHWCWVPVTNYDQGYIRVPAGADPSGKAPQRPAHVYSRPGTVPLPMNPAYSKPFKPVYVNYGVPTSGGNKASSHVSARLTAHIPKPQSAGPAYTKTYGGGYNDVSGRLMPPRMAMGEGTSVSGKLLARPH
jgi:hypothetical protein